MSSPPSIRAAVLVADYGTLFHQIKHQRDVVKAAYGPLSEVVSPSGLVGAPLKPLKSKH